MALLVPRLTFHPNGDPATPCHEASSNSGPALPLPSATSFFCMFSKRSWSFCAGCATCCSSVAGSCAICGCRSSNLCMSPAMPSTASWSAALWVVLGARQGGTWGWAGGNPENCPATGATIKANTSDTMAAMASDNATELSDAIKLKLMCGELWRGQELSV